MSSRAVDIAHVRRSSSHPVKLTFSPQGSACAGIEPGTSRTRAFFALTHSMNMQGRAAEMVTPIGDKKTLLPAESAVSRNGCAGRGRVQEGSSRKNKWKHARLQGAQRREGVCVGLGCDFSILPEWVGTLHPLSRRQSGWGAAPSTYTP